MASKHIIQFYAITQLCKNRDRQLKRGEIAYNDGHVIEMIFDGSSKPALLKGTVHASQRKYVRYRVEINFDPEKEIEKENCKCTCAVGQDVCHHMVALLLYAHYNVSTTDIECRWTASTTRKATESVQSLAEMFPMKEQYTSTARELTGDEIDNFREKLGATSIVGFSWLLKPEITEEILSIIPTIEDILYCEEYVKAENKEEFLKLKCEVSTQRIVEIQNATIGQHVNENWLVCRKLRLTSSKFGIVLSACQRNKFPPSLFRNLTEGYDLQRIRAVQWGKDNEKSALATFMNVTGITVKDSGLWLDNCGFLAASPDGLIGDNCTLEIKCPYKYRDGNLKTSVQEKKDYFFYTDDGEVVIKMDHNYYHQVQSQLYLTGREKCYFFVWTLTSCSV